MSWSVILCCSSMNRQILPRILLVILAVTPSLFPFLAVSAVLECNSTESGRQCACENQILSIFCDNNSTIHIIGANFGRLDNETCNDGQHSNYKGWNLSCRSNKSLEVVSKMCNNKASCSIAAKGNLQPFDDPCPGTGKYLTVNYSCISGDCHCPLESKRDVSWRITNCNSNVTERCPNNPRREKAYRWCSDGSWASPNLKDCITEEIEILTRKLEDLKANFSTVVMKEMMTYAENISRSTDLYGGDLYALSNVIVELVGLGQNNSRSLNLSDADNMNELVLNSTSNLLSNKINEVWKELLPRDQSKTATRLLVAMGSSSSVLAKAIRLPEIISKTAPGIEKLEIDVINITEAKSRNTASVTFITSDSQFKISLEDVTKKADGDGLGRIVFIVYDDIAKRLKVNNTETQTATNKSTTETADSSINKRVDNESKIVSKVISASIDSDDDHHDARLKKPVRFTLHHQEGLSNSSVVKCVFWKYSKTDHVGHWSEDGCKVVSSNDDNTTCECCHLTNFAILMSTTEIPFHHSLALHVITYIGCTISIVCLVLALCTFCFFRNLQSDRNTIHKNLVLCLLISELVFVFGITQHDYMLLCAVVAGFLHYFLLASFAWMCLEGTQLYILLIEVFQAEKSRIKWYYLGGYGVPALIVLITISVNAYMKANMMDCHSNTNCDTMMDCRSDFNGAYGTEKFCWLSTQRGFIWAFIGPVIAIIALNAVMLGVAIYMMCKHVRSAASWKDKSKISTIGSWLRGVAILVVLLGTTWIFGLGLLYSGDHFIPMSYIFTIFNSLQGLFIFVFHCLMNDKVQKEYQRAIQRSEWLPVCIRVKYGDLSGVGTFSTPKQSTSSGKTLNQRAFPKNEKNQSLSSSSVRNVEPTSPVNGGVRVIFSSPEDLSISRHVSRGASNASESARLKDSSGWESGDVDPLENVENLSGYFEQAVTSLNESEFNASDCCESSVMDGSIVGVARPDESRTK